MLDEQQHKFLKRVEDLFLRFGIKCLTMDDIARELGISKKTLYQHVSSKDELVRKVIERYIDEDSHRAQQLNESATDAIDALLKVIEYNAESLRRMKSNVIFELQRFFPDEWEKMQQYHWGFLLKVVESNLHRGISEGYFRNDFNPAIVARLHLATAFSAFDERIFSTARFQLSEIFGEMMLHYLHGIISEKGRAMLSLKPLPQFLKKESK